MVNYMEKLFTSLFSQSHTKRVLKYVLGRHPIVLESFPLGIRKYKFYGILGEVNRAENAPWT